MSTELSTRSTSTALTIQENQTEFTPAQVATLRQLGVEGASREDLAIFFHQSVRTGLDPFARQIYMIGRYSKGGIKQTIQTGIDGYRLIARRAVDQKRETLGYEDTLWCGEDGHWQDVWLKRTPPAAAKVTVLRNGQPYSAVALFSEYAGTTKDGSYTQMWATKGAIMIAKCAEALALRKAFPQDLSGIYTAEEMQQADISQPAPQPAPNQAQDRPKPPTISQAMNRTTDTDPVNEAEIADIVDIVDEASPSPAGRDWVTEIGNAAGDTETLTALWHEATTTNAPQEVIAQIVAAGNAAKEATT